jgi:hypothetical protein
MIALLYVFQLPGSNPMSSAEGCVCRAAAAF